MRVVALFRVSTDKQQDQGSSLESQAKEYHDRAARLGWDTVAEFRGSESASGAASDRQVLQKVLGCLRDKEVDAIWVIEQSRLTRGDELEVAFLMRELRERGVKIIVRDSTRDPSSIDEGFMLGIQSLVDRTESLRIKERMQRGRKTRAGQGRKTCGPSPFGYRNPPPGAEGRGTLVVVPEEAATVRRVFALAASGKGGRAIAGELNRLGLPAPRGGRWGKSSVGRVIQNPAYIGVSAAYVWVAEKGSRNFRFQPGNARAVQVPNAHAPIIDRETWDAVHGRAKQVRTATPRLLSGLLWCNGRKYGGDVSRGRAYYSAGRGAGSGPWLEVGPTDDAVWEAFSSLATSPSFVERLMREAASAKDQELIRLDIEDLEAQADKLVRRLDRLTDMRAEGEITKDQFLSKSTEAREALGKAQAELAELRAKAVVLDGSHAARVVRAVQTLLAGRTRLTGEQRRAVLRSIVRRVDVVAEATGSRIARDERGRVLGSGGPRWKVASVSFRLSLAQAEAETEVGTTAGDDASRDRGLATTGFSCNPASAAAKGGTPPLRDRRWGTND